LGNNAVEVISTLSEDELGRSLLTFFNVVCGMLSGKQAALRSGVCHTPWYFQESVCWQHENF
jgi:hypothetical protein